MKQLQEQLVAALGWCGVEATVPSPEPSDRDRWRISFEVATNRYTNANGVRRLQLEAFFTPNAKWLFVNAVEAYRLKVNDVSARSAVQEAVDIPNSNWALMSEFSITEQHQAVMLSIRTCVAGVECLRHPVQHLLDDLIHSADHYHDLLQIAVLRGQCIPQLVQDSGYVLALFDESSKVAEDEEDEAEEQEEQEGEEEDDEDDEDDGEPNTSQLPPPPPPPRRLQLPWE
jgi:hypothetical protein